MNTRRSKGLKAVAMILAFAMVQISFQLSFAAPAGSSFPTIPLQEVMGRVTTRGTQPITINGTNAASGDSVATGAMIQTPSGTEATIDLGPLGSIELSPGTRVKVDYVCPPDVVANPNPQACKVNITVFAGCIVSHYKQGTHHEIRNDKQELKEQSDPDKERSGGGTLRTCFNAAPLGAIAAAGGLGKTGLIALLAAAAIIPPALVFAGGGDEPSPSTP